MRPFNPLTILVVGAILSGCAYSAPSFRDITREWDPQGNLIRERVIRGRQPTIAPPFSSRAFSTQRLRIQQVGEDRWSIGMGSDARLEGGDIAPAIEATGTGLITPLVDKLGAFAVP